MIQEVLAQEYIRSLIETRIIHTQHVELALASQCNFDQRLLDLMNIAWPQVQYEILFSENRFLPKDKLGNVYPPRLCTYAHSILPLNEVEILPNLQATGELTVYFGIIYSLRVEGGRLRSISEEERAINFPLPIYERYREVDRPGQYCFYLNFRPLERGFLQHYADSYRSPLSIAEQLYLKSCGPLSGDLIVPVASFDHNDKLTFLPDWNADISVRPPFSPILN